MYEERKGPHPGILAAITLAFIGIIVAIYWDNCCHIFTKGKQT